MLHDPGITPATYHSDLVGLDTRLPRAHLCGAHLPVPPAFHLLDLTEPTLRKGTQGPEIPLQALPLQSSPNKGRISWEGDVICQKVLCKGLLSGGQSGV